MRKDKFLVLDEKEGKDIKEMLLMCMLDADKLRSFKIVKKGNGFKIWIYHKITDQELRNYEDQYKGRLKEIEKFIK